MGHLKPNYLDEPLPPKPVLSQLGKYLSGLLELNPEAHRIAVCGICDKESYILEWQQIKMPDEELAIPRPICFDCAAPSFEFNTSGNTRNEHCKCGSEKRFKDCCLQLCERSNSVTTYENNVTEPS